MIFRDAGLLHLRLQIHGVRKIATGKQVGKAIEHIGRKVESLADFTSGAAPAIGDYIRGHRRTVFTVTPTNLLDDALSAVAARQIEINIRPTLAAFAEETFEQQI